MRTPLCVERAGAADELSAAMRDEKKPRNQLRLRAVLAVVRGQHVPAVAKAMQVAERSVRDWVHGFNAHGVSGLMDHRKGRQCRLSPDQLRDLKQRIRGGPREADKVCSLRGIDVQRILQEEHNTSYSLDGVYYLLHHQLQMSYLKPRPLHRKTDVAEQDAFKKNSRTSSRISAKNTPPARSKSGSRTKAASVNKAR